MRNLWITALALLAPSAVLAAQPEPDDFNMLFATTCMKYFYAQDDLRKEMAQQRAGALNGEQADFFLGGQPGTAWIVTTSGEKYVVSLRDDKLCAVFAQRAKPEVVQRAFIALVDSAPEPLTAKRIDDPALGPNTSSAKTTSYSWGRAKDDSELVFTLTTSDEVSATVQAMASIALIKKPD